jgi:hypothetical protein
VRALYLYLLLATVVLCRGTLAAQFSTNAAERILANRPFAATVRSAETKDILCTQIDDLNANDVIQEGDSVTVLITLTEKGGEQRQWLLHTHVTAAPSTNGQGGMVIYNNFGHKFEFPSTPTPVTLRTVGPFIADPVAGREQKIHDDTAHFDLDKGYLGLGLDRAAAASVRIQEAATVHGPFRNGTVPFSPAEIEKSQELATNWKLTSAEERALAGSYPALLSYFNVVQHTEDLFDIASNVIDRPSLFSLAIHLGIRSIGFDWQKQRLTSTAPRAWGLPANTTLYEIPMILMLNEHPSLNITMVVTAPHPPLLTSAGIIGILAEHPKKTEPYLTLRVISGKLSKN